MKLMKFQPVTSGRTDYMSLGGCYIAYLIEDSAEQHR